MSESRWLWYPGDFERYHAMVQNFSRVERGCAWPAFWKSEGFRNRVTFRRTYQLKEETAFTVLLAKDNVGYIACGENKYPAGERIVIGPGNVTVCVHIASVSCLPSMYIVGDTVRSDEGWMVEDYAVKAVRAASSPLFTEAMRDPTAWTYAEKVFEPIEKREVCGGVLFDFGTELTAAVELTRLEKPEEDVTVYLGESEAEALAGGDCYFYSKVDPASHRCPRQALRYAFIPDIRSSEVDARAIHQYIDIPVRAAFRCSDPLINRIFDVARHTFMLCTGCFFLDGIKRDKWIWSGDAYQSLFVNRYLTADPEVEKRTLTALSENDPVTTHINTILDYSLLWILGVHEHVTAYADRDYLDFIYPKMESLMQLCLSQRDQDGLICGREQDWVFIDWADFDREGPLCAEQMLFAQALKVMAVWAGEEKRREYEEARSTLLRSIEAHFWDEEKQAYVDSYVSGRRNVTRHANIFAILFGIADDERCKSLLHSVLLNDAVPKITTPYFRFFELEAMCRMGLLEEVLSEIRSYWGGMLELGASTFWEEYVPGKPLKEQYAMYGDPFGKSLCHAWAASPIYLLARYYLGLKITETGYTVEPRTDLLGEADCVFPVRGHQVHIRIRDGRTTVTEE